MKAAKRVGFVLALAALSAAVSGETLTVKVNTVPLGDVFTTETSANLEQDIHLAGADAPDKEQPYSKHATKALSEKILGQELTVTVLRRSSRGTRDRILGKVMLGERCINQEMVEEGWAWHNKKQDPDKELAAAEAAARLARRGLWQDASPTAPWDWRRKRSEMGAAREEKKVGTVSNKDAVFITTTSNKYHRGDCRRLREDKKGVSRSKAEKWSYKPCPVCKP